jgi:hypothetical protein
MSARQKKAARGVPMRWTSYRRLSRGPCCRTVFQTDQQPSVSVSSLSMSLTSCHSTSGTRSAACRRGRSKISLNGTSGASRPTWLGANGGTIVVRPVSMPRWMRFAIVITSFAALGVSGVVRRREQERTHSSRR